MARAAPPQPHKSRMAALVVGSPSEINQPESQAQGLPFTDPAALLAAEVRVLSGCPWLPSSARQGRVPSGCAVAGLFIA